MAQQRPLSHPKNGQSSSNRAAGVTNGTQMRPEIGPSHVGPRGVDDPTRPIRYGGQPSSTGPDRPLTLEAAFPWLMSQLAKSPTAVNAPLTSPAVPTLGHVPTMSPPLDRTSALPTTYEDELAFLLSERPDHPAQRASDPMGGVSHGPPISSPSISFPLNLASPNPFEINLPSTSTAHDNSNNNAPGAVGVSPVNASPGWNMWDLDLANGQIPIDQATPDIFPHNYIAEPSSSTSMRWPVPLADIPQFEDRRNVTGLSSLEQRPSLGGQGRSESLGIAIDRQTEDEPVRKRGRNSFRRDSDAGTGSGIRNDRVTQSLGGGETSPKRRSKSKVEPREIMEIRSRRFRDRAPKVIKERVHKVLAQRMYLLDRVVFKDAEEAQEFTVMGSKGDKSVVAIDHEPRCDCPDWQKGNAPCEHLIYVFLKILKIPEQSYLWFQKGLLSHELRDIFENTRNPTELPPTLLASMSQHLSTQTASGEVDREMDGPLAPLVGTDCQICYDAFTAEDIRADRLAYDEGIQQMVHKVCFDRKNTAKVTGE
ncbi:hypothetical protein BD324DRAFT_626363 [Kockovaella imperatae]|uniref:SWIM-type domain-containing protein n=1 Tax=Kockovaella imperatae TaxID=4999 RepID=A0A1Y1UEX7_9TREE|nr:hypothetical protein BD324DRAFT_626363 [Kockovaella imperatae]ORX36572.1 hypothetical protein BD324DRAFT_626363 [Kockovaella imperatae]